MKNWIAFLFLAGAALLLSFEGSEAGDANASKKKKGLLIAGQIVNAIPGKDGGKAGTITVHGGPKTKKDDAKAEAKDFVFKIDSNTKIEKLIGKKKDEKSEPGTFGDLQVGRKVIVQTRVGFAEVADTVMLLPNKKK